MLKTSHENQSPAVQCSRLLFGLNYLHAYVLELHKLVK
jgi:hypothetical protein